RWSATGVVTSLFPERLKAFFALSPQTNESSQQLFLGIQDDAKLQQAALSNSHFDRTSKMSLVRPG
ncbi:MAG TPA: hypothetical protein P5341_11040, partial [Hyphomonas sp.]|nr:hypothetical protein [Hyphomonas sp.]